MACLCPHQQKSGNYGCLVNATVCLLGSGPGFFFRVCVWIKPTAEEAPVVITLLINHGQGFPQQQLGNIRIGAFFTPFGIRGP